MTLVELKEALAADKDKAEAFERALAADECKACGNDAEAFSMAARMAGLEISPEEVERAMADGQELDAEELRRVSAGTDFPSTDCIIIHDCKSVFLTESCYNNYNK